MLGIMNQKIFKMAYPLHKYFSLILAFTRVNHKKSNSQMLIFFFKLTSLLMIQAFRETHEVPQGGRS